MESTAIVGEKREFIEENEEEEDDEKPTKGEKEGGNVKETFVVKRKRPISSHYKSLNSLLKAMQNMQIVIECKNDVEVSGIVDTVSKNMDIGLNNAKEVFPDGRISESLFLQVNGSAIRYVHLPPKLNTHLLMNNYFKNLESNKFKSKPISLRVSQGKRRRLREEAMQEIIIDTKEARSHESIAEIDDEDEEKDDD